MWSDNETDVYQLDYRHLVGVTFFIIRNKDLHPKTITKASLVVGQFSH